MKVKEAYRPFLEYGRAERGYSPETTKKFQDCFASWILPRLGNKAVEDISSLDILKLKSSIVEKGLGAYRQYSILTTLKLFFKFSRRILKLKCLDPDEEISLPKRPKPQVQYLTQEELQRVLRTIDWKTFTGLRLYTLVIVLAATGLRISEALSLNRHPFEMGETQLEIVGKGNKREQSFSRLSALSLSSGISTTVMMSTPHCSYPLGFPEGFLDRTSGDSLSSCARRRA